MTKQLTRVGTPVKTLGLTKGDLSRVETRALTLYAHFNRDAVLFAAQLRKLQDGGAHLLRGFPNFGEYVERTFDGISAANAQQLSRQGNVMLILERTGRIRLEAGEQNLPGTTGLRALSRLLKDFGEDAMLAIYDAARDSGRKVIAETVAAAARELVQPMMPELTESTPEPSYDDESDEYDDPLTERQAHLLDRLNELRDSVADLVQGTKKEQETAEKVLQQMQEAVS